MALEVGLEGALEDYLSSTSRSTRLTSVTGTGSTSAVFIGRVQTGLNGPALRLQRVATARNPAQEGPTRLAAPTFQVDSFAPSWNDAKNLSVQVRRELAGFSGTMGSTVNVRGIQTVGEGVRWDEDIEQWRVRQDYRIWHFEATS